MPVSPRLNPLHACSPLRGGPAFSSASRPASSRIARRVPVSMIVSEPGVMSEFSSDTEADLEDKLRQLQRRLFPSFLR